MKTLIKLLCLSVLWFSCESSTEPEELCDNNIEVELWGECYNIETTDHLDFNGNYENYLIIGEIPPEIGDLVNLMFINLRNNELSGEIPYEIGNLTNLEELRLINNQLTGEIPSSIGNLTNLDRLELNDNQLTGEIPSSIGNLPILDRLVLHNNQLSGEIPSEICNLFQFTDNIFLWENQLCPPYPDCGDGPITSEQYQDTSNCP